MLSFPYLQNRLTYPLEIWWEFQKAVNCCFLIILTMYDKYWQSYCICFNSIKWSFLEYISYNSIFTAYTGVTWPPAQRCHPKTQTNQRKLAEKFEKHFCLYLCINIIKVILTWMSIVLNVLPLWVIQYVIFNSLIAYLTNSFQLFYWLTCI